MKNNGTISLGFYLLVVFAAIILISIIGYIFHGIAGAIICEIAVVIVAVILAFLCRV